MIKEELQKKRISAICLGCDKNRVDLETMLGYLKQYGFKIENDIINAEIIIVNTCAFIGPAEKEAIENIFLALSQKSQGVCEKVIVTGCLFEKHGIELKKILPEVDLFLKVKNNDNIVQEIEKLYNVESKPINCEINRVLTTPKHYAYLKISDGCNNGCAYCTIPRIRGRYVSTPMEDLLKQAKYLASIGTKELIVVAQDITKYGQDIYEKPMLIELLSKLEKIKGIEWIRLHYCYPENVTNELLTYIYSSPKICNYIDIPLQHIDNQILANMNRKCNEQQSRQLIDKIKKDFPHIAIRSTFIVGFPQESSKQFKKLISFIKSSKLNNVGFFPYYREQKTKAYFMKGQISNIIKKLRLKKIQKTQQTVANILNLQRIGQTVRVIIDSITCGKDSDYFVCRDEFSSPDVDFNILVPVTQNISIGNFINIKITGYTNTYFKGEIL